MGGVGIMTFKRILRIIALEGGLQRDAASSALGAGGGLLSGASSNIGNEAQLAEQRRRQVVGDVGASLRGRERSRRDFLMEGLLLLPRRNVPRTPKSQHQGIIGAKARRPRMSVTLICWASIPAASRITWESFGKEQLWRTCF